MATHFPSRILTTFEQKKSINELELLAVVWAIENFRNYVCGIKFEIISDHKALTAMLKGNRANKTYSSRLTRWVDNRLLPFQCTVTHSPGRTIGVAIESEMTKEKEQPVENAKKPTRAQIKSEKQTTKEGERTDSAEKEVLCKQKKQTIKGIIASINTQNSVSSQSDSDSCEQSTIEFADKPLLKTPICYSINQIEIVQILGNYLEFMQLVILLDHAANDHLLNSLFNG